MKKYIIPMSIDYIKSWTVSEALRELVQNQIDNTSEAITEVNEEGLFIGNRTGKLSTSTLVLGSSTKSEDRNKLGEYGEGYKLAMLVLLREGCQITIYNSDKIWKPSFEYVEQYDTKLLVVNETINKSPTSSIIFHIVGIDNPKAYLEGIQIKKSANTSILEDGTIYYDEEYKGKIYVGGLFVCTCGELTYGYDFMPGILNIGRDRNVASDWDILSSTADLWSKLDANILSKAILRDIRDVAYLKYKTYKVNNEVLDILMKDIDGAIPIVNDADMQSFNSYYISARTKIVSPLIKELIGRKVIMPTKKYKLNYKDFYNLHKKQFSKQMHRDWGNINENS